MIRWAIAIFCISLVSISLIFYKSESKIIIPIPDHFSKDIDLKILVANIQNVKLNKILYQSTELNHVLKNDTNWVYSWLDKELLDLGLTKINTNTYIKKGELDDSPFLIATDMNHASCLQFLTIAQKISVANTKYTYTFITKANDIKSFHVSVDCSKNQYFTSDVNAYNKLKICAINQQNISASYKQDIIIVESNNQEDFQILDLCNFCLVVFNLNERGFFNGQ